MKATVMGLDGKKAREIELPMQFSGQIDAPLIKRAVLAIQSAQKQAKAPYILAGRDNTAVYIGARGKPQEHRTINTEHSRKPRMKNHRGIISGRVAAIPGVVGGPKAHPPKVGKILEEKINAKEKKKATASAIAATASKETVRARGHVFEEKVSFPIVVEASFEQLEKTGKVKETLENLGVWVDVEKAKAKKQLRAGKGKKRGRKYKKRKSVLIVVADSQKPYRAARNIEGVDIISARNLNADLLAPGAVPGRLTLWTEGALKVLSGEKKEMKSAKVSEVEKVAVKKMAKATA